MRYALSQHIIYLKKQTANHRNDIHTHDTLFLHSVLTAIRQAFVIATKHACARELILSVCLSVRPSVRLSVRPSVCLSICLSLADLEDSRLLQRGMNLNWMTMKSALFSREKVKQLCLGHQHP